MKWSPIPSIWWGGGNVCCSALARLFCWSVVSEWVWCYFFRYNFEVVDKAKAWMNGNKARRNMKHGRKDFCWFRWSWFSINTHKRGVYFCCWAKLWNTIWFMSVFCIVFTRFAMQFALWFFASQSKSKFLLDFARLLFSFLLYYIFWIYPTSLPPIPFHARRWKRMSMCRMG